jgi:hypothetical protein
MVGGLALRERRDGERLVVRAGGPLTSQTTLFLQAFIATHLRRQAASVVIVDLTRCVYTLTDEQLSLTAASAASGPHRVLAPLVLVVPPMFEGACERYCAKAAKHGLLRMCYLTFSEAMEWASSVEEDWPSS